MRGVHSSTLVAAVILGGCAQYRLVQPATPPIDPLAAPPDGLATVCVFRPQLLGTVTTMTVRDNGHLVGATRGEAYFCWFAEPGEHEIVSERVDPTPAPRSVVVRVASGERRHLYQSPTGAALGVEPELHAVDAATAAVLRDECDYEVLSAIPGGGEPPAPVQIAPATRAGALRRLLCRDAPAPEGSLRVCFERR